MALGEIVSRFFLPAPSRVIYPQERLRQISHSLNVSFLDLLPLLREEYGKSKPAGRPMFFDHCHLTPYGSGIVAAAIYEFLKQAQDTNRRPGGLR